MRHFLIAGEKGECIGLGFEAFQFAKQKITGQGNSAFDDQDFLSNALGAQFFDAFADPNGNLDRQLEQFFEWRKDNLLLSEKARLFLDNSEYREEVFSGVFLRLRGLLTSENP